MSETALFDRLFIGDGEYVRADTAIKTVGALNAEIASLRAQLDEAKARSIRPGYDQYCLADIAALVDEARRKAIEECAEIARLQANYAPEIFADKALQTTYELACGQASGQIRALLSESKS